MIYLQILLTVLTLLLMAIAVRTLLFRSQQKKVPALPKMDIADEVAKRLGNAIKLRTISYYCIDKFDHEAFTGMHNYLEQNFPLVHSQLQKEIVSDYGLLYTWQGSDSTLDPIMLMAHQDVVPVEKGTESDWTYPPFSGEVQDGYIWGRGALDIKCSLMGTLEAVEFLLGEGYTPTRTVYLSYGFDEEIKGERGAKKIAALLHERNVRLEYILDEGGFVLEDIVPGVSKPVASIGVVEKGYLSLEIIASSPGGHSSMPPQQTAATILADAIKKIANNPFPTRLEGISRQFFSVVGPEMSLPLKTIMANLWLFKGLLTRFLSQSPSANASIRTTAAVTMLEGGETDNVLPQKVKAVVNIRIFPGETIATVKNHISKIIDDDRVQVAECSHWDAAEPTQVADTMSLGYTAIERSANEIFSKVVVAPFLLIGVTDSRHFQKVSNNIYRFAPMILNEKDLERIHGTNERIGVENYKDMIRLYIQVLKHST